MWPLPDCRQRAEELYSFNLLAEFSHLEAEGARHHSRCRIDRTKPNRQNPDSHGAAILLGEAR